MPKQATTRQSSPSERRSGGDRRRIEGAPPGNRDRRLGLEPRLPEVMELEMTNSEWMSLSDDAVPAPKGPPPRR